MTRATKRVAAGLAAIAVSLGVVVTGRVTPRAAGSAAPAAPTTTLATRVTTPALPPVDVDQARRAIDGAISELTSAPGLSESYDHTGIDGSFSGFLTVDLRTAAYDERQLLSPGEHDEILVNGTIFQRDLQGDASTGPYSQTRSQSDPRDAADRATTAFGELGFVDLAQLEDVVDHVPFIATGEPLVGRYDLTIDADALARHIGEAPATGTTTLRFTIAPHGMTVEASGVLYIHGQVTSDATTKIVYSATGAPNVQPPSDG